MVCIKRIAILLWICALLITSKDAKKEDNFQELISELDWRFYKVQWTHIRKVIEPINLFLSKLSATEITTPTEQMNELETVFRNSFIDFEVYEFVNLCQACFQENHKNAPIWWSHLGHILAMDSLN